MAVPKISCDVVLFGGGVAGLWILDELRRRNTRAMLLHHETTGSGQTALAQGILHGGTKYGLCGSLSPSARVFNHLPALWRSYLFGEAEPDLRDVQVRAEACCLWRSERMASRSSLSAAQLALDIRPTPLVDALRPAPLRNCPGAVYQLNEQVIDPVSLIHILRRRNRPFVLSFDDFELSPATDNQPHELEIWDFAGRRLMIQTRRVILSAGAGNEFLRRRFALSDGAMQRRPLHVVFLRGELPELYGHCVDGAETRMTITSSQDSVGRTVWQLGGLLSERGVTMSSSELISLARRELVMILPGWRLPPAEWATQRVDRAEGRTIAGLRPDDVQIVHEGTVMTIWPTKLVLTPRLVEQLVETLNSLPTAEEANFRTSIEALQWPAPPNVRSPWEQELEWISDD